MALQHSQTAFGRWNHIWHDAVHRATAKRSARPNALNMVSACGAHCVPRDYRYVALPGVIDEALEEFVEQVDIELADLARLNIDIVFDARPSEKIQHHA